MKDGKRVTIGNGELVRAWIFDVKRRAVKIISDMMRSTRVNEPVILRMRDNDNT